MGSSSSTSKIKIQDKTWAGTPTIFQGDATHIEMKDICISGSNENKTICEKYAPELWDTQNCSNETDAITLDNIKANDVDVAALFVYNPSVDRFIKLCFDIKSLKSWLANQDYYAQRDPKYKISPLGTAIGFIQLTDENIQFIRNVPVLNPTPEFLNDMRDMEKKIQESNMLRAKKALLEDRETTLQIFEKDLTLTYNAAEQKQMMAKISQSRTHLRTQQLQKERERQFMEAFNVRKNTIRGNVKSNIDLLFEALKTEPYSSKNSPNCEEKWLPLWNEIIEGFFYLKPGKNRILLLDQIQRLKDLLSDKCPNLKKQLENEEILMKETFKEEDLVLSTKGFFSFQ